MRQKSVHAESPSERIVKNIRRATRKRHSSEEKIRIVLDGLRGEGMVHGNFSTITKIQQALEREGINFTAELEGGFGVRLEKKPQRG